MIDSTKYRNTKKLSKNEPGQCCVVQKFNHSDSTDATKNNELVPEVDSANNAMDVCVLRG